MPKPNMLAVLKKLVDRGEHVFTNRLNEDRFDDCVKEIGMEFWDDRSCEEADVVVCMRTADGRSYTANSTTATCASCGEEVHLSPRSPLSPPKVCMQCVDQYNEEELFKRIKRKDA